MIPPINIVRYVVTITPTIICLWLNLRFITGNLIFKYIIGTGTWLVCETASVSLLYTLRVVNTRKVTGIPGKSQNIRADPGKQGEPGKNKTIPVLRYVVKN